jgi:hypothetical protein
MQITKDRFTTTALGFVEPEKEYDYETVISETAFELAGQFFNEFAPEMSVSDIEDLRKIFRRIGRNAIDWSRVNRKAHPREYADSIEYDYWPEMIRGEL